MGGSTSGLRVLLVEDDEPFAAYVGAALRAGAEPIVLLRAGDLAGALASIPGAHADAVVLDLNLPDSHGLSTLHAVLAVAGRAAVIVLTGLVDGTTAREALKRGAQDWLVKGATDPEQIQRALRYAVERKSLSDRLARAQTLEIAGRLASGVAHEFNNILTTVAGSIQLLQEAGQRDVESRDAVLDLLRRAVRHGGALTQQLLSLARTTPTLPVLVSTAALIDQSASMIAALLPAAIALEVGPVEDVPVRVDSGQLVQVLLNLAINARDAMPAGGRLGLSVVTESTVSVTEEELVHPEYAVVRVSDTGVGIDAAVLPHVFTPFFSTKGDSGTGLGLAICADVVAGFGGGIRVDSQPGVGSTFKVYLPVAT